MMGWRTPYFRERLIEHLQLEVLMGRVTLRTEVHEYAEKVWVAEILEPDASDERAQGDGSTPERAIADLADQLITYHTPEGLNGTQKA